MNSEKLFWRIFVGIGSAFLSMILCLFIKAFWLLSIKNENIESGLIISLVLLVFTLTLSIHSTISKD
jgi:hypothetical protein